MNNFKHALLFAAVVTPVSLLAAPKVAIDGPAENSTQSGITQIYGWASDDVAITSISMLIDGDTENAILLGMGGDRADVAAAFPEDFDPLHSGFATAFHSKLLSNGSHTITVIVTNENDETTSATCNIIASNTPQTDILADEFDLSAAEARISRQHIFLDGVVVNGVSYDNFELRYDNVINGFRVSGFGEDRDHDGFADDDEDRDGFHDDDDDRDGFHDDDKNYDGFHDDDKDHDGFHDMGDNHGGGPQDDSLNDDG